MIQIKPKALLVCGLLANTSDYTLTALGLARAAHVRAEEMYCLLNDMVSAGMLESATEPGYATEYSLKVFTAEIGVK